MVFTIFIFVWVNKFKHHCDDVKLITLNILKKSERLGGENAKLFIILFIFKYVKFVRHVMMLSLFFELK